MARKDKESKSKHSKDSKVDEQLQQLGLVADYEPERGEIEVPEDYVKITLEELNGEEFEGKPMLFEPYTYSFTDNETNEELKNHAMPFAVIDDDAKEYVEKQINLKDEGDIQENVKEGSVLFDLLRGIAELRVPKSMTGQNVFRKVDLSLIRNIINDELDEIEIESFTRTIIVDGQETTYWSIRILNDEDE